MDRKLLLAGIIAAFIAIAAIASIKVVKSTRSQQVEAASLAQTPAPSPVASVSDQTAEPTASHPATAPALQSASQPATSAPVADSQPAAAEGTYRKDWGVPVQQLRVRAVWRDTHAAATPTTVTLDQNFNSGKRPLCEITDADGFATFKFPQSWSLVMIAAHHKEATAFKGDYTLPVNQPLILAMERGASVFGRVRLQGGKTVAGATVTIPNGRKKETTDADGTYVLSGFKAGGGVKVLAYWKDYISFDDLESVQQFPMPKAGVRYGPHDVFLKPGRAVIGTITDAETKQPILNAKVNVSCQVREATASSNPAGFYRAAGLPKSDLLLRVRADGYALYSKKLSISDEMERREDVQLEKGGNVNILVVDEQETPVSGARVYYMSGQMSESIPRTDATGHVIAKNISIKNPPSFRAVKEGYGGSDSQAPVFTPDGAMPQVKLTLRKEQRKEGAFTGKVTDKTGKPIVGATVSWLSQWNPQMGGASARTDATGVYKLKISIREGSGEQLSATCKGYAPVVSDESPGTADQPKEVNFQLDKGHYLKIDVVDSTGQPVKTPRYTVSWPESRYGNSMLPGQMSNQLGNDSGHIEITDLPSPRVKIQISAQNKSDYNETVDVDQALRVELKDQGVLRGRVQDEQGRPITKFKISGHGQSDWSMELNNGTEFSDPRGKFIFTSLDMNQTYSLTVGAKGYGTVTRENFIPKPEAEAEEILFTLKTAGQLRGIVVDTATNAPLQGVRLAYGMRDRDWGSNQYFVKWQSFDDLWDSNLRALQYTQSDADGSFSFDEGDEQGLIMVLPPPQYARLPLVPTDRAKYQDADGLLRIPLQPAATITGRYLKNGQPVSGAELHVSAKSNAMLEIFDRIITPRDGSFNWTGLAEGSYSLTISARWNNFVQHLAIRKVELKTGETKNVELGADMGPYTLSGRVLDGIAGVDGVFINLTPQFPCDYESFGGYSSNDGQYKIEGLFPGTYQAHLSKWESQSGRSLFDLNETIEIRGDMVHDFGSKPQFKVTATLAFPPDVTEAERKKYINGNLRWADETNPEEMQKNPRQLTFGANSELNDGQLEFKGRFDGKYSIYLDYNLEGQRNYTQVQIAGPLQLNNLNGDQNLGVIQVPATGSIRLLMDFDPRPASLPRDTRLILSSGGKINGSELPLNADEMEQIISPIAFGTYKAMLYAMAYRVEPPLFDVTVGPGETPTVGFILSPDGWTRGVVMGPDQRMQITPTRIILTGPIGFTETLVPRPAGSGEMFLAPESSAGGSIFIFKNLAAGTYNLTVEAACYQTYTGTRTVVPGQFKTEAPIQLTPAN